MFYKNGKWLIRANEMMATYSKLRILIGNYPIVYTQLLTLMMKQIYFLFIVSCASHY